MSDATTWTMAWTSTDWGAPPASSGSAPRSPTDELIVAWFTRSFPRAPASTVEWIAIETFVTPLGLHDQTEPARAHAIGSWRESKRNPTGREQLNVSVLGSRGILRAPSGNCTASRWHS